MHRTSLFLFFLILCLVLAACAGAPEPTASPATPTTAPAADVPTVPVTTPAATALPTPAATTGPTTDPWQTGTPAPLLAPLTNTCLGQQGSPPQLDGPRYGLNVFLFATDAERVLALTNIAGFKWIRQQIHWRDIEGTQGEYVWKPLDQIVSAARAHDQQIMLSVVRSPEWATAAGDSGLPDDPATLATFLRAVAERYEGRVAAYQVWNEPNLSHENGGTPAEPAEYLALLEASYQAIKETDPCALVVSASLAATNNPDPALAVDDLPFFESLYTLEEGTFLRSADIVGMHTGAGANPPAMPWPSEAPEQSHQHFRHMERSHEIMQRYGDQRQVWLTEYGWTVTTAAGAPLPVSEAQQASYLIDALWYARHHYPWVSGMFVWNLNFSVIAPPSDEKTTYSVLRPDWSVRPAFLTLQNNIPAMRDLNRSPVVPEAATHRYAWSFPGRGRMRSTPIIAPGGTVYVVSDPGTLYATDLDGQYRWQMDAPGAVTATPARGSDGTLYVGDSGSLLTATQPDGTVTWTARLDSPPRGSPVPLDNGVAAVSTLGTIYAFDSGGQQTWTYTLDAESTPLARTSDGALLVVSATGQAVKLASSGEEIWRTELEGEFWAAPVSDGEGGVYIVTAAGRVLALDSAGELRWTSDLGAPVIAPPLVGNGGRVYIAARNGTLAALSAADGSQQWAFDAGSELVAPPVQGPDGTLYQGTTNELLLAIAPDGVRRWQVELRGNIRAQPAVGADGALYVPTMGGRMYKFAAR
jgi:outer membrane protein assembly factor BamB